MKNIFFLGFLFLSACASQLRQSVCTQPLSEWPEEFRGIYEMVVPASSL